MTLRVNNHVRLTLFDRDIVLRVDLPDQQGVKITWGRKFSNGC